MRLVIDALLVLVALLVIALVIGFFWFLLTNPYTLKLLGTMLVVFLIGIVWVKVRDEEREEPDS